MTDTMREKFDVWVNVYPPLPAKYQNAFGSTLTAHETREDALNNAGHSCRATCLLHFNGERLETAAQADARALVGELGKILDYVWERTYMNSDGEYAYKKSFDLEPIIEGVTKAQAFMEGE